VAATLDDITCEIAGRRQLSRQRGARHDALGYEFTRYLRRNPNARKRVAGKRLVVANSLADYTTEGIDRSDAIVLGSRLDDAGLYRPILDVYMSAIKLP
jgi:hypothetical protein